MDPILSHAVPPLEEVNDMAFQQALSLSEGLLAHQIEGVAFLLPRRRCIMAGDMSLGKAESYAPQKTRSTMAVFPDWAASVAERRAIPPKPSKRRKKSDSADLFSPERISHGVVRSCVWLRELAPSDGPNSQRLAEIQRPSRFLP
jgi:hypothetical protein